jgi:MOB kinase activator 1
MLKAVFGNKNKTFRPKKNFAKGTKLYQLHKYAKATVKATLGAGNLHEAVVLPEGEDKNEWLAVNTVDFFNQINLLYGSITEFCTKDSCACMSAGPQYEYHWADGVTIKKPIMCSAPEYVDYLMSWVQAQLDDEGLFPSELGAPRPPALPRPLSPAAPPAAARLHSGGVNGGGCLGVQGCRSRRTSRRA